MLVTTAMIGDSMRNEPSLSSASATRKSPCPSRALVPSARSLPPTTTVGSRPASRSTVPSSEVVVVLPCVPAIAMPYFMRISSASISARGMTGILSSRARATSGLANATADEMTSTSTPSSTWVASCGPVTMCAPRSDEATGGVVLVQVGSGHAIAEREQHLGDAAHADPADADEVDASLRSVHRRHSVQRTQRPPGPPNLPSHDAKHLQKQPTIFKSVDRAGWPNRPLRRARRRPAGPAHGRARPSPRVPHRRRGGP